MPKFAQRIADILKPFIELLTGPLHRPAKDYGSNRPQEADGAQPMKFSPPQPPRDIGSAFIYVIGTIFLVFAGGIAILGTMIAMTDSARYGLEKSAFDATNDELIGIRGVLFFACCFLAVIGALLVELLRWASAIERRLAESAMHQFEFYRRILEIEHARQFDTAAKAAANDHPTTPSKRLVLPQTPEK